MLANLKKNRNIKANDVNLISMARSTEVCFKTSYVCFCAYDQLYIAFSVRHSVQSPSGKVLSHDPPPPPRPRKLLPLNPPPPLEFPMIFWGGGGGVWIFSGTTHSFLQYLVCITLSPANLISSCVSGCKDAKKVSFTAGHSRSCD